MFVNNAVWCAVSCVMHCYAICVVNKIRAAGGLIKFLEKERIGFELEETGVRIPILAVKLFTLLVLCVDTYNNSLD